MHVENEHMAGFTLVETLTAMVILTFGLISISNLFLAATQTNMVANTQTAATSIAAQQLELLKEMPFTTLAAAGTVGSLTADAAGCPNFPDGSNAGNCFMDTLVPGLGQIHSRWTIAPTPTATGGDVIVLSIAAAPLSGYYGAFSTMQGRSVAQFTTMRACVNTSYGCP
jgi:type II secretory pathway pseudopilin PulG